jgi:hypothetical protein
MRAQRVEAVVPFLARLGEPVSRLAPAPLRLDEARVIGSSPVSSVAVAVPRSERYPIT